MLLFTYAVGHVLLLFLAGASSGWASRYAESHFSKVMGRWLPRLMGVLLVGCAVWVMVMAWQSKVAG